MTLSKMTRALLLCAWLLPLQAWAQQLPWPNKTVRLVVPAAAGGPTDLVARVLAEKLTATLGQTFIVDNRAGAGHMIGTEAVARSAPDGYVFGLVTTPHVINPALQKKMPYDTLRDLEPVSWLTSLPLVLVVSTDSPVRSVRELVELAKAKPGQLNLASAGTATGPHLAGELFKSSAAINIVHVPYKGGPQATTAMLSGEAALYFDTPSGTLPHIKSGKLRALAVTTLTRSASLPDVPTMAESGFPGFEVNVWNGLVAPAGVPREIMTRMQAEVLKALAQPDVRQRFAAVGFETVGSTPAEFGAYIEKELTKWRKVVQDAGMSAN
jgi:tripartite-type tricarboxylate transporter receptor subunit TctC